MKGKDFSPRQDNSSSPEKLTVSARKLEANRRNAQKSTGPKTPKGKAHSRRNAVKHGLFVRPQDDILAGEDLMALEELHKRFWDEFQPVGPSEEFEVEQIAICWLRLRRLWEYENAEIAGRKRSVAMKDEDGEYSIWLNLRPRITLWNLLVDARQEAEVTGKISPELKEKIFAANMNAKITWSYFVEVAEQNAAEQQDEIAMKISEERKIPLRQATALLRRTKSLPERERFVAVKTIVVALGWFSNKWSKSSSEKLKSDYQRQSIPDDRVVDKVIRYGNAFERQMTRSYDRLERLQRRRKGEPIFPPVRVQLTQ